MSEMTLYFMHLPVVNSTDLVGADTFDRYCERSRVVYTTGATSYQDIIILYGSHLISDKPSI